MNPEESKKIIKVRNLKFKYKNAEKNALNNINFEVREGEFVLITGPSGSGKSTLAKILTGLIPNSYPGELDGEISIMGFDPRKNKIYEIAQNVGLVLQNPENQLFALTVEDDVAFGPENLGLGREEIRKRVEWSLDVVNMQKERHKAPFELSGGLQQRAAIAAVLAMKPKVLILDEPTSYLDTLSAVKFSYFLDNLRRDLNLTVILIEQNVDLFFKFLSRIVVMSEGKILIDDKPDVVISFCIRNKIPINIPLQFLIINKVFGKNCNEKMLQDYQVEDYELLLEKIIDG
ncbi:MAG: ABC transporter ATP-binding protein [Thermoproteota archaeon]|nr:ABC transporter ATP-binding protein [Candidatus Brockarchaeota archaeon]MBO3768217.1 ABC transporter ATP-binding protein [Candidatus Brockarchaeota archaeon]MBO3801433.1 ABC transporter ATP-binding protein [Candidatus Brockarchaeota archaeon]